MSHEIEEDARATMPLAGDAIRIRWLATETIDDDALARCRAILDADERARANRFTLEIDRKAFIAAHALTRLMLADASTLSPLSWRFLAESRGKPEIAPAPRLGGLRFNLSHTRGIVACAVGWSDDLGVDVETIDRSQPLDLDLADQFFAPAEADMIRRLPAWRAREAFLRIWTLKEAFIKATGEGLARTLDSFSFTLEPIAIAFRASNDTDPLSDPQRWRFAQFSPTEDSLLAIALRRDPDAPIRLDAAPFPRHRLEAI
jgi:4'-phosphopantetheinyl transferase